MNGLTMGKTATRKTATTTTSKDEPDKPRKHFKRQRQSLESTLKTESDQKFKRKESFAEDDAELTDTIFLRNVSRFDTTQESLKAHMEENFGPTVYCLLCKDKETDECRGTAFVKFKEPETARKCLDEFKDRDLQTKFFLDGRNLFVLPALTRNQVGEVKQASAKIDKNVIKKKKFKKARHHRVPVKR